jgi:hypothetical protein
MDIFDHKSLIAKGAIYVGQASGALYQAAYPKCCVAVFMGETVVFSKDYPTTRPMRSTIIQDISTSFGVDSKCVRLIGDHLLRTASISRCPTVFIKASKHNLFVDSDGV